MGNGMPWLLVAAGITIFIAAAHSYLGEKRIFPRLLNRNDPPALSRSPALMRSIVRWAWHLTSFAWVALAAILIALLGDPSQLRQSVGGIVAAYLGIGAIVTFATTRGRHIAWPFFLVAAVAAWFGTR
jgi:uncharacterized membrane protein YfcA